MFFFCLCLLSESKRPDASKDAGSQQDLDDLTVLKSLADSQKPKEEKGKEEQYVPDESDSTKSRRLAEDYDSTKNGMDYGKYQGTHTYHCAPGELLWPRPPPGQDRHHTLHQAHTRVCDEDKERQEKESESKHVPAAGKDYPLLLRPSGCESR